MRILFLDAYFEPEQIAFTHLENDLLEGLVNAGHEVEIVCPTPTRGVSKEVVQEYKNRKTEALHNGHVHVRRFSAPQEGKNPVIRALRYFWCNLRTYQIGKRVENIDVVFANSTPPTQGWIAGKVAKKLKAPFVYSLQDIFPDSLVNAGMTKKGSLIWRIGRWIENKTYKGASTIITISEGFKKNLIDKGVNSKKVEIIPNWIDTTDVYDVPRSENKIIRKYKLDPNRFFICYSGNIGHSQNLELLVEVAKEIVKKTDQIEFVIIGEGAAKEQLRQMVEKNGLSNIHLLPFQPYEDIAHVYSLGDVGLIISKPDIGGSSIPSKTWSVMAAQRPVLSSFDKNSDLFTIINEAKCGIHVRAGECKGMVEAIIALYNNPFMVSEMGQNGRKYLKEKLNKSSAVSKYITVTSECIKK